MLAFNYALHTQSPRLMYINSADAAHTHDNTTHFHAAFREALHVRPHEAMLVSLHSASVPYSFYNIREGVNNKVRYKFGGIGGLANDQTLTIPKGNYTVLTLRNAIVTHVNENLKTFFDANTDFRPFSLALVYVPASQKYTFSLIDTNPQVAAANEDLTSITFFLSEPHAPAVELGFPPTDFTLSAPFPTRPEEDYTKQSTNVADINGSVHALYLRTDIPTRSVFESETG
eukprot:COSAG01_NODE_15924_length_1285_cov_8.758010_2_plen_229_part_01